MKIIIIIAKNPSSEIIKALDYETQDLLAGKHSDTEIQRVR